MKVHNLINARRVPGGGRAFEPTAEIAPGKFGKRRVPAYAKPALGQAAQEFILHREIRERREPRADLAHQFTAPQQPVTAGEALAFGQRRFRQDIHLRHWHTVRTNKRAHAASRAIIYGAIKRNHARLAEALRLW